MTGLEILWLSTLAFLIYLEFFHRKKPPEESTHTENTNVVDTDIGEVSVNASTHTDTSRHVAIDNSQTTRMPKYLFVNAKGAKGSVELHFGTPPKPLSKYDPAVINMATQLLMHGATPEELETRINSMLAANPQDQIALTALAQLGKAADERHGS